MFASWETTARYAWNKTRFSLSIPFIQSFVPHNLHIKYDIPTKCIKIYGNYEQNVTPHIYDTQLSIQRKYDDALPNLYHKRVVEENGKSELHFPECCPKK